MGYIDEKEGWWSLGEDQLDKEKLGNLQKVMGFNTVSSKETQRS